MIAEPRSTPHSKLHMTTAKMMKKSQPQMQMQIQMQKIQIQAHPHPQPSYVTKPKDSKNDAAF
jgi:hypothetical protein